MSDVLMRVMGWRSLLIHGDPCVLDRWLWLKTQLRGGPLRTLDAGCGNGAFSIYAARQGNEVVAASFSADEQRNARRRAQTLGVSGVSFQQLDLRELGEHGAELGCFDQVICLETIEHVSDDERLVRSLAGLLSPGGRLLLTVPFDGHRPLYGEERDPSGVEDGSHVRYGYSPDRLRRIARGAGLEVHSECYLSGVISQAATNLMRRLTRRLGRAPAWLLVLPLRPLVLIDRPLTELLRSPYLSAALCAQKPEAPSGLEASAHERAMQPS